MAEDFDNFHDAVNRAQDLAFEGKRFRLYNHVDGDKDTYHVKEITPSDPIPPEYLELHALAAPMVLAILREDTQEFNRLGEQVFNDRAPDAVQKLIIALAGMAGGSVQLVADVAGDDPIEFFNRLFVEPIQ